MKDKVAIPIWNRRISPVMDTASQLLIFKIDDKQQEVSKEIVPIPQLNMSGRIEYFLSHGITILICGAISHHFEQALRASGIEVKPFLGGNVDDIIIAYSNGTFKNENYLLPGCKRRRRRGRRGGFHRKQFN